MSRTETSVFRRRLPFLGLLVAAVSGILLARLLSVPSPVWLAVTAAGLAAFLTRRAGVWAVCLPVFATVHVWQSRESPGATLADWLGPRSVPAVVEGVVSSEPRVFPSGRCSFEITAQTLTANGVTLTAPVPLLLEWPGVPPSLGQSVRLTGSLTNLPPARNPGQFDFAAWMGLRGVFSAVSSEHADDARILPAAPRFPVRRAALACRQAMQHLLTLGVDDPTASDLIVAMVLGETSSLPESVQEQFRGTGTFHLFSVSGLHVGMLAVLLWTVLRTLRLSRRQAALVIIPAVLFYALMTGGKPASVRAAIMTAIVLAGFVANRRPVLENNLCAAGFLILLADTNQLFQAGFQLSFSVVATILVLAPHFTRIFEQPFAPDPFLPAELLTRRQRLVLRTGQGLAGLTAVSAAAWVGSLPLTLGYFHLISLSALPANLVAVPISFGIMAVAMLSLVGGAVLPWLAVIFNETNRLLAHLLLGTIAVFAQAPGSFVYLGRPEIPRPEAEMVVFDCGEGGAVWLQTGGAAWLLDTGPASFHDAVLLPFLRSQGRRDLDGLLVSHGDAKHLGAATDLIVSCPPARLLDSMQDDRSPQRHRLHQELISRRRPKSLVRTGDRIRLSPSAVLTVLHPPAHSDRGVADDKVVVCRLDVGRTRVLLLSDASFAVEQALIATNPDALRCDLLVKGAPRSGPTGDAAFLDAARPRVVIAAADTFPESAVLDPAFAESLRPRGIRLFRQDQTGAVTVRIFSDRVEIRAFLGGQEYSFQP